MKWIILCAPAQFESALYARLQPSDEGWAVATADDLPARLSSGTWTIVRRDSWKHDGQVVDALRRLEAPLTVQFVDPSGLLGSSRYGFDIGREAAPIVQRSRGGRREPRSPQEPPAPRRTS